MQSLRAHLQLQGGSGSISGRIRVLLFSKNRVYHLSRRIHWQCRNITRPSTGNYLWGLMISELSYHHRRNYRLVGLMGLSVPQALPMLRRGTVVGGNVGHQTRRRLLQQGLYPRRIMMCTPGSTRGDLRSYRTGRIASCQMLRYTRTR